MESTALISPSPFAFVDGKPLEDFDGRADAEAVGEALQAGVVIVDHSANGKLLVQGEAAEAVVSAVLPVGQFVYRLRQDLYFVSTLPGGAQEHAARLARAVTEEAVFVTVTDVTHGRSELSLLGPDCAALMSVLCGLDFSDRAFPDGTAKQTSLAKTKQLIVRRDEIGTSAFAVIGGRSFASYLWETTMKAGAQFGIKPVGPKALHDWRQSVST